MQVCQNNYDAERFKPLKFKHERQLDFGILAINFGASTAKLLNCWLTMHVKGLGMKGLNDKTKQMVTEKLSDKT